MVRATRAADKPRLQSVAVARGRLARIRALLPDPGAAVAVELVQLDDLLERLDDAFACILAELRRPLLPETVALLTGPPAADPVPAEGRC